MSPTTATPTRPWPLWLKLFWIVFGGAICLLWGVAILSRIQPRPGQLNDFVQEWTSARNYWTGDPIYEDLVKSVPRHMGFEYPFVKEVRVNAHPPTSILLVVPLGRLDFPAATRWWNLLSLVALGAALLLLVRKRGLDLPGIVLLPIFVFLLTSNSFQQQVNQAQLNLLLLLLLVGAWSAQRESVWWLSGALVGVAAAIKLFPGFLLIYFICQRQWKAVAGFAIAAAAMIGLTVAVLGVESMRAYVFDVMPQVGGFRDWWANASLLGWWSKLFDGSSGHVTPLVHLPWLAKLGGLTCVLAVTAAAARICWQANDTVSRDRAFSVCVIGMMLASPITWDHYFVMLLLPFLVFWEATRGRWASRLALCVLAIALCTVNPAGIWRASIPGDGELVLGADKVASVALPWHSATVLAYQTYGLLLLFGCALAWSRQPARATAHLPVATALPASASAPTPAVTA